MTNERHTQPPAASACGAGSTSPFTHSGVRVSTTARPPAVPAPGRRRAPVFSAPATAGPRGTLVASAAVTGPLFRGFRIAEAAQSNATHPIEKD